MGGVGKQAREGLGRTAEGQTCSGQKVAGPACPRVNYKMPQKIQQEANQMVAMYGMGGKGWEGLQRA